MSVNSHLTSLSSDLVLSASENSSISTSISNLSSKLDAWFGDSVSSHFQFGSSTRGTILPRKADSNSDIDYMVVFKIPDGKKKPQTYLDRLRKFAEEKYPASDIKQSHPTIVLSLNHISFELVPAVYQYGYEIPSPASDWLEWITTDPSGSNQALQDKNGSELYRIKPLVRLVKYWNAQNGHPFPSFSLEQQILDMSFWGDTALKDYFYKFWESFNYSYLTAQYIKNKVDIAKERAAKAKKYEEDNMPYTAEKEIKKIVPEL